jgi:hypothetical protein
MKKKTLVYFTLLREFVTLSTMADVDSLIEKCDPAIAATVRSLRKHKEPEKLQQVLTF